MYKSGNIQQNINKIAEVHDFFFFNLALENGVHLGCQCTFGATVPQMPVHLWCRCVFDASKYGSLIIL